MIQNVDQKVYALIVTTDLNFRVPYFTKLKRKNTPKITASDAGYL